MQTTFKDALEENPMIAAVRHTGDLAGAAKSRAAAIFMLGANILELEDIIQICRNGGKRLLIHMDLMEGLGHDPYAIRYLKQHFDIDGIITTRSNLIKYAQDAGLFAIQRVFLLDSRALETALKAAASAGADAMEVLPGIVPGVIGQLTQSARMPII
ncbi:MAG: glycerol-3-phosphate responsive antiterminator, partial [Christensenellales bacterium]